MPDARDHLYAAPVGVRRVLPRAVDLRPQMPPVYDQGACSSCTANALAAAHQFDQIAASMPSPYTPSRLFIYYGERALEHTVDQDAGAMIRDGIKVMAKTGVCPETLWPYDVRSFAARPPPAAFATAAQHKIVSYARVPRTLTQFKGCLAEGFPFVFGFSVYESFESDEVARTGVAPMPSMNEELLGGHAVLAVGYDDVTQRFTVRNSWGSNWADAGYFTMPYAYLLDRGLAADFWTIRRCA